MSLAEIEDALRNDLPNHWIVGEAEVTDCTYIRGRSGGRGGDGVLAHYVVGFSYKVNGTTYRGATTSPAEVKPHDKFSIRYNSDHPEENNSIASQFDRPWFKEYTWLIGALVAGAMLVDFVRHQFPHMFHR